MLAPQESRKHKQLLNTNIPLKIKRPEDECYNGYQGTGKGKAWNGCFPAFSLGRQTLFNKFTVAPAYFPSSLTHAKGLGLSEHPVLFPPLLVLVLSAKCLYFRVSFSTTLFQTPHSVGFVFYLWVRVKTRRLMRSLNSTLSYTYFKSLLQ